MQQKHLQQLISAKFDKLYRNKVVAKIFLNGSQSRDSYTVIINESKLQEMQRVSSIPSNNLNMNIFKLIKFPSFYIYDLGVVDHLKSYNEQPNFKGMNNIPVYINLYNIASIEVLNSQDLKDNFYKGIKDFTENYQSRVLGYLNHSIKIK